MTRMNILVDEIPANLKYERNGNNFFAECDGFVSYFAHADECPRGEEPTKYKVAMKDGTEINLKGKRWSSSPEQVEKAGFGKVVDVCIVSDEQSFNLYGADRVGAITEDLAREIAAGIEGVEIGPHPISGSLVPVRKEGDSNFSLAEGTEIPEYLRDYA